MTLRGESINLLFNGTRMNEERAQNMFNRCSCVASASDCLSNSRLLFHATDVRMQNLNEASKCHRHSQLHFTDSMGTRKFSCSPYRMYKGHAIYYSNSPYARIIVDSIPGDYPSQVWLKVKGNPMESSIFD